MNFTTARRLAYLALIPMAMSACVTAPQFTEAERARITSPISCGDRPQCDVIWSRMQAWVATNSRWRIQTANDTLIQTFGPGNSSTDLAYTLVRVPRGDGTAEISVRAGCANIFGCFPDAIEAIKAMRLAVGVGF